ncbi:MAG: DNA alkylation repair protein [Bacteroidales bacterium]|jgi:3-methyladenine DNA glycosylase AlkD|nr:DNA alkylation repair protein [Bacteroidales bacterium]
MTISTFIDELKDLASEALRKEYIRNGGSENVLGLKYTYLQHYKKELGKNHAMALKLWETQIPEVQILATMIADQNQMTAELIEKWNKDINFYLLSDAFIGNILSTYKGALQLANKWINENEEYTMRHAYTIIFMLAKESGIIRDSVFEAYLKRIEQNIQNAPNRAKETMLYSILNIGRRNKVMNAKAIDVMEKIGNVQVDHGTTGGITPDVLQILKLVRKSDGYIFMLPGDMI